MKPLLFPAGATSFVTNGIGALNEVVSCRVTEALNGEYELNMTLLVSDKYFDQVKVGSIIVVVPSNTSSKQAFVVESVSKNIAGEIEIYAVHIAQHRSKLIPVGTLTATDLADAINKILANSLESNPFTLTTDKSVSTAYSLVEPRSFRECLGGREGSLLDIYGGEYKYDNFNIQLLNHRGKDDGVQVLYGMNMEEFNSTSEFGWDQSATGVLPYWVGDDVTITGSIQYSQYKDNFPYAKTVTVDFSDQFEEQPTVAQLNAYALNWINSKGLPVTNINVSVDELIGEYNSIGLGDTVHIINDLYGINYESRVISTEFDVLSERYVSVEIGDKKASINDAISDTASSDTTIVNSGGSYTAGGGITIEGDVISSYLNTDLLWTNPNPTTSYGSASVDRDLSGYRFVLVGFRTSTNYYYAWCEVGRSTYVFQAAYRNYRRSISVTTSGVAFGNCQYYATYGSNTASSDNTFLIPNKIWGVK